jgi:lipopolysaccharide export system protein LptA
MLSSTSSIANATANNIIYTAADDMVRMRGGDPTVWDSRARTKAVEIDSNNGTHVSVCRGKVATTYLQPGADQRRDPFKKTKSPVYISGDRAEIDHDSGRAVYSGTARVWQDDNYVRGDSITLYREEKRMESWGHVQSALYQAKQKTGNSTNVVPVFATAEFMRYSDPERLLHYETNVDIKQGTDRVTAGLADVYLQKDTNEVERTIAQKTWWSSSRIGAVPVTGANTRLLMKSRCSPAIPRTSKTSSREPPTAIG